MEKIKKTKAQWPELLSDEAYFVTYEKGMREHLVVNMMNSEFNEEGIYECIC
ncbi:hypothetical protein [Coxiella-like endosymbiont]|uniref:hypothetical protein n=1 Tax=Coxiella-like endosymbiont TaxID=1592897 RepID=UPI00272D5BCF|nr:hypothetical protein [Coxiella-like endosymbiont]